MPELPEVETVVRVLKKQIIGRKIISIDVRYPKILKSFKSIEDFKTIFEGKNINNVRRRGKFLIFDIGDIHLVNHLRMEGKWFYDVAGFSTNEKHDLVIFSLDNGYELRYNDTRRFGTFDLREGEVLFNSAPLNKVGYEPFDNNLSAEWLKKVSGTKKIAIKTFLLDQGYIAGIGNIYASEICFYAKIDPTKEAGSLTVSQWSTIIEGTKVILSRAIEMGGTTISSFHATKDSSGEFVNKLKVYGRKDQSCITCGEKIIKFKQNGRSTFFCKRCQNQN